MKIKPVKKSKKRELKNGWTDESFPVLCNFRHFPIGEAEELREMAENASWVVETINWTLADGDRKTVHHNKYISFGLGQAVAWATKVEIDSKEVAESLINIRPASEEEHCEFLHVLKLREKLPHPDLAMEFAKLHPEY